MEKKSILSWFLLVLLSIVWGSSFILMLRGMQTEDGTPVYSDVQVGALRMTIAGLVMFPFGVFLLKKIRSIRLFFALLIVGTCGNFIPAFLFTYAETELSSGLTGMLNSFTSFFTIIIGYMVFRQAVSSRQVYGLVIAFAGICLLVGSSVLDGTISWPHIGAVILATVLYATSLNTIKYECQGLKSLEITAIAFTLVSLPALAVSYFSGAFTVMTKNVNGYTGLGYIAILSIVGTCIAVILFNRIIAWKSAVFASSVTYLIPIVAIILGCYLNAEKIQWQQVLGMVVIIGGVALANRQK
jgi:drug/metabolite transporter (DMT)-like permease